MIVQVKESDVQSVLFRVANAASFILLPVTWQTRIRSDDMSKEEQSLRVANIMLELPLDIGCILLRKSFIGFVPLYPCMLGYSHICPRKSPGSHRREGTKHMVTWPTS